jgi:hypothetical protein
MGQKINFPKLILASYRVQSLFYVGGPKQSVLRIGYPAATDANFLSSRDYELPPWWW